MKTVVLLGAGASRASDFRLPTMRGFFAEGLDGEPELREYLELFCRGQDPESYNLETILGYLDLSRQRSALWGYAPDGDAEMFAARYRDVLQFIRRRLAIPDDAVCTRHDKLVRSLGHMDSIVSLNYDLIVENVSIQGDDTTENRKDPVRARVKKLSTLLGDPPFWGNTPPSLTDDEESSGSRRRHQLSSPIR